MDVLESALDSFRVRITKVLPEQVRNCLGMLDEEQIWWRPNEQSNSVGNIVLHLSGSLNYYLNRGVGGIEYTRDRDAEFAERRHIPKDELRATFDDMVSKAEATFDSLTLERLGDPSPEPRMQRLVIDDLIAVTSHFANHTGQIVWITKMLLGGAVDEVWIRAHREFAWTRKS
jgi:uncharacterized damage-inducible protein DinB